MLRWFLTMVLVLVVVVLVLLSLPRLGGAAASPSVAAVLWDTPSSSVVGHPSLSADFIDAVLLAYHSPAVGLGQAMYQDSLRFGIDDAYALAFFWHESTFGRLGVAAVTRSVGNIVCTSGFPSCIGRFRSYGSWQAGCLDWFQLIAVGYVSHGLTTIERIIPVYAPASENNVSAYIAAVRSAVTAWRAGRLEV